jgi:hypothetical protein
MQTLGLAKSFAELDHALHHSDNTSLVSLTNQR